MKHGWISNGFIVVAITTITVLWKVIVGANINILASALIAIPLLTAVVYAFHAHAWQGLCILTRDLRTLFALIGMTVTTFCFSSVISGDWDGQARLSAVCVYVFGLWMHLHHWPEGLALIAVMAWLLSRYYDYQEDRNPKPLHHFGAKLTGIATGFFVSGGIKALLFWNNQSRDWSVFLKFLGIGGFLLILGILCRSSELETWGFRICMALALGVGLGTFGSGIWEMLADGAKVGQMPSTLIFFGDQPDAGCMVPPEK